MDERDPDTALRLSSAVWHFWYARGYLTEGSRWLEEALQMAPDVPRLISARAKALTGAGVLAHYQGHYARAATLCGQSLALGRQVGDQPGIAAALHGLALVARSGGDFATARTMYEEARRIHEALGDRWGLSYTLRYLAVVLWMEADYTAARAVIDASLSLAGKFGKGEVSLAVTATSRAHSASTRPLKRRPAMLFQNKNRMATGGAQRRRCGRSEWRSPDRVATARPMRTTNGRCRPFLRSATAISWVCAS
jgi:tetratricopeptide (TPR) repeat protein